MLPVKNGPHHRVQQPRFLINGLKFWRFDNILSEFWAYFHRACAETAINELPVKKSDPDIRSGDLDFLYDRCISTTEWRLLDIFDVLALLRHMTLWPWPLTFWPWECLYGASHVRPTYQLLLSYDYRLLSYEYWIYDHISVIWNSHCACAVSRDL